MTTDPASSPASVSVTFKTLTGRTCTAVAMESEPLRAVADRALRSTGVQSGRFVRKRGGLRLDPEAPISAAELEPDDEVYVITLLACGRTCKCQNALVADGWTNAIGGCGRRRFLKETLASARGDGGTHTVRWVLRNAPRGACAVAIDAPRLGSEPVVVLIGTYSEHPFKPFQHVAIANDVCPHPAVYPVSDMARHAKPPGRPTMWGTGRQLLGRILKRGLEWSPVYVLPRFVDMIAATLNAPLEHLIYKEGDTRGDDDAPIPHVDAQFSHSSLLPNLRDPAVYASLPRTSAVSPEAIFEMLDLEWTIGRENVLKVDFPGDYPEKYQDLVDDTDFNLRSPVVHIYATFLIADIVGEVLGGELPLLVLEKIVRLLAPLHEDQVSSFAIQQRLKK